MVLFNTYDMRSRLTETNSRHFSEGLYYAENLPEEYVSACYNGSISAVRTSWADTVSTFAYSYDPQNRLLSSNRVTHSSQALSERFTYDPEGNILSLKRFSGSRTIDDLTYSYGSDGNRLLAVTDNGQDADLYSTIEYHHSEAQADTTMFYDANGNLIRDLARGIAAIKYNILNLPDTILFANGNRIINLYDAAGRKYKSVVYTNIATAITPSYDLEHAAFDPDSMEYCITEYAGNIETIYTPRDTTRRIFNTIGYRADNAYYYFIKDHLGNICAVVNSSADTVVQSTLYYASGVPMAQSWGRETQPYLYNGKEFVEAHGLNSYDYGFRGYYAPTGRFTSIDPLAEQTPWQSPYSYANNNFINAIDYMGLMQVLNWCAVDGNGNVKGWGRNGDYFVYEVDDDWDGTYEGLDGYGIIGIEIPGMWEYYKKDKPTYYIGFGGGGGLDGPGMISGQLMYGNKPVTETVNTTIGALWHYFTGEGEVAQNGNWSKLMFGTQSEFLSILLSTYILGKKEGHGKIDMEFVFSQFHIGDTFYDYYVTDNMLVISFGLGDGFRDANFVLEILGIVGQKLGINTPDAWAADRLGSNLELPGGVPFNYAPSFIILPFYGD